MKRWTIALVLLLSLLLPQAAAAQDPIRVVDQSVETAFRDHITFNISLEADQNITQAQLFYRVAGQIATARGDADIQPDTHVEASFTIDQTRDYLPPGTELEYWWKISDQAGDELKTDPQSMTYMDERHDWQKLENDRLALYWYEGDQAFGQALFDQANKTLDQIEKEAGVKVAKAVKIFIYGNFNDLRDAIAVGSQEWTGGQAFTDQGVVVIGVAPNDLEYGLAATPHELTHLVIHQATDNPFGDIPRWLDEGLAVYMSGELHAGWRGYDSLVNASAKQGKLMSLQTLSSSFPADPEQAGLAYAESGMVVEFIIDHYGQAAMAQLLDIFSQGALYDDALKEALGVDTWGLDNAWRESMGFAPIEVPGLSPDTTPAAQEVAPAVTTAAGETPAQAAAVTPAPAEESAPAAGGRSRALPCLGSGLTGAAVLGLFFLFRARGTGAG